MSSLFPRLTQPTLYPLRIAKSLGHTVPKHRPLCFLLLALRPSPDTKTCPRRVIQGHHLGLFWALDDALQGPLGSLANNHNPRNVLLYKTVRVFSAHDSELRACVGATLGGACALSASHLFTRLRV
jgi:hypothetical protein